jgi:uncharacterized membrane protein YidH (DUF202 family)
VLVLAAGFVLSALGFGLTALRGITRDGKFVSAKARLGLFIALAGVACWTLAVYRA